MAWYFVALNVLFAALVVGVICGGLVWAIFTQHRHHGCEHVRLRRRRLRISFRLEPLDVTNPEPVESPLVLPNA